MSHYDLAVSHSESILLIAKFQDEKSNFRVSYENAFMLGVVSTLSPDIGQRKRAYSISYEWKSRSVDKSIVNMPQF
jgi:hypothetical protein